MYKKIIHIDMDAFFASVEQRDNPHLRGKPVAVGGKGKRGVVAAASYEARKYGVRSAMPGFMAIKKCPQLIFVKGRFEAYREASEKIRDVFYQYTDLVEPLSLDEAFLDVTENKFGITLARDVAKEIKKTIKKETLLTASAGISFNKFLAKVASDYQKPDGLFVIHPDNAKKFLNELPIEKFYGIGKVTAKKMRNLEINTGADLRKMPKGELTEIFGKSGTHFYYIVRGQSSDEVVTHRTRKSIGAEHTFEINLSEKEALKEELSKVETRLWNRMEKTKGAGRTLTMKLKYEDFEINTRSKTFPFFINSQKRLHKAADVLLSLTNYSKKPIRLIGLSLSNLETPQMFHKNGQLYIPFPDYFMIQEPLFQK